MPKQSWKNQQRERSVASLPLHFPQDRLAGKDSFYQFPFLDQHGAAYSSPLFTKQESEVAARLVQIGIDTQRCPEFNDCALLIANPYERSSEVAMRHG
jgi:hypothetical protein